MPSLETTGAFKPRKMDLVADGFDPRFVKGALYFRDRAAGFVAITPELHARIIAGDERF